MREEEITKVETNSASICKDKNGIVHVLIKDGTRMDYYDALDHFLIIKNLSENKPVLKLMDVRSGWSIQRRARKFLESKEVKEKTIARAIVQNSSFKMVVANFFNDLKRPKVPTKMFTDYNLAYAWLLSTKELNT